ncbi:MAG: ATP-binding protein [Deferrisomatales bacterium]
MSRERKEPADARRLRRRAEDRLHGGPPGATGDRPPADLQRLVHELQVHQVELELQNEELRSAQAELEAARDAAQAASRAKSTFLTNMSHEIRTPLSGVIGMLRLLRETPLDDTQQRYAELASTSAVHLLHLIDDLLDLSKIEAGKLELESATFDPRLVVEEAVRGLAVLAQDKGIGLACRIAPEVPGLVAGDPHRLRQVLVNLIGNAVKFTEKGQVEVTVSRAPSSPVPAAPFSGLRAERLSFSVRDTGIGIPAGAMDRLFASFSQADDSMARVHGGTGLGLAISRQLVEHMGGSLGVESEEGRGSVFTCTIPFTAARAEAPEPEEATAAAREAPSLPTELRILVAEDEPVNREVAVALLQHRGWRVTAVADGSAAVEAWLAEPFDLVLMDVQMPGLDGFAATRLIRQREGPGGARVPIVGLTAHALKGDRERCLAAGMDDYLAKPVAPETLYAAVERWVGRRAGSREARRATERTGRDLLVASFGAGAGKKGDLGRSFLGTVGEGPGRLREALAKGDAGEVAFWAHRLAGSLSVFGFTVATGVVRALEALGEEDRLGGAGELLARLEEEIARAKALLVDASGARSSASEDGPPGEDESEGSPRP